MFGGVANYIRPICSLIQSYNIIEFIFLLDLNDQSRQNIGQSITRHNHQIKRPIRQTTYQNYYSDVRNYANWRQRSNDLVHSEISPDPSNPNFQNYRDGPQKYSYGYHNYQYNHYQYPSYTSAHNEGYTDRAQYKTGRRGVGANRVFKSYTRYTRRTQTKECQKIASHDIGFTSSSSESSSSESDFSSYGSDTSSNESRVPNK